MNVTVTTQLSVSAAMAAEPTTMAAEPTAMTTETAAAEPAGEPAAGVKGRATEATTHGRRCAIRR